MENKFIEVTTATGKELVHVKHIVKINAFSDGKANIFTTDGSFETIETYEEVKKLILN